MGLRTAGPRAAGAVPILIELLKDRQIDIYVEAANCLGEIGPAAAQAVPELERLRYDPDPQAGQAAESALEKIRRAP
jgi:HEAT repeat protein